MSPADAISPAEFAQTIKGLLAIDQVVAEYVPSLTRRGATTKGLCPFHNEKTPSFHVNPEFGYYHCFGCGAHGDALKFIQEIEKVDFMIALEMAAKRAGVAMPTFRGGAREDRPEQEKRLAALRELCTWAGEFFVEQLAKHPRGALARQYLHRRGLSDELIARYRLGYSPDAYEALLGAAARHGWSGDLVAEAGLASRREQGGFVDRFRDRVMFTILDRNGQPVAFAGRLLEDRPDAAKYINSAETPIFKKSNVLYGMWHAREAIRDQGGAILLEGYMDWITMHRFGLENVLAGMGTAFTEEQARLIKRLTGRIILLYDGDAAGQKAMFRASEILLRQGLDVRAAVLPVEHDPDTFLQAEGTAAMRDLLSRAPTAIDYFMEQIGQSSALSRPEGKADAVGKMAPLLLAIGDPALREGYLTRVAGRFGLRLETLEAVLRQRARRTLTTAGGGRPEGDREEGYGEGERIVSPSLSEQNLLYILLRSRDPWQLMLSVDPSWFQDPFIRRIFERLFEAQRDIREGADPPDDLFSLFEDPLEREWISKILLLPTQLFGGEVEDFDQHLADGLRLQIFKLRKQWHERRKRELIQDLQMILGDDPIRQSHLAAIEALTRESIRDHAHLIQRNAGRT